MTDILTPAEAARDGNTTEEHFCDHCRRFTTHTVHDGGHERDSSGDWRECHVCRWKWNGFLGEYRPPSTPTEAAGEGTK